MLTVLKRVKTKRFLLPSRDASQPTRDDASTKWVTEFRLVRRIERRKNRFESIALELPLRVLGRPEEERIGNGQHFAVDLTP